MAFTTMLRQRLLSRSFSYSPGPSRWTRPGHQERPNDYPFKGTQPPPDQSSDWVWLLPLYVFVAISIFGEGPKAKPDLTNETSAHKKALEQPAAESSSSSD